MTAEQETKPKQPWGAGWSETPQSGRDSYSDGKVECDNSSNLANALGQGRSNANSVKCFIILI